MSKISFMLGGALLVMSACSMEAQPNYTVTCPAGADANNTMAYLIDWDSAQKMDSVIVTDGVARFEGHVDVPMIGRIMLNGARGPIFFIEKGDVTIGEDKMPSGTPLNDKFVAYQKQMADIVAAFRQLDCNDSTQMAKAKEIEMEYMAIPSKAYNENKDNVLGLFFYMQNASFTSTIYCRCCLFPLYGFSFFCKRSRSTGV